MKMLKPISIMFSSQLGKVIQFIIKANEAVGK